MPDLITFFDLDGTLLYNMEDTIPASALYALSELRKAGIPVVLSTGRDMDTHYSRKYLDIIRPDAIIHQNGCRITVGDTELLRHYMDPELVRKVYEFCKDQGFCVGTSIGDLDYYVHPERKYASDLTYKKRSERHFVPFERIFEDSVRVSALSFAGDIVKEKPVFEAAFPTLRLYPFNTLSGADVVEEGFSKAEGLMTICSYYGVDEKDTFAFGDSANDVALLLAAGTGIAMGNADDAALTSADYITDDIMSNGIYNACVHFCLIRPFEGSEFDIDQS